MVRFKNRHLLVEFLQPSRLDPTFLSSVSPPLGVDADTDADGEDDDEEDDNDDLIPIPTLPFLLPLPSDDPTQARLKLGDEGGGVIYRAIRGVVQDVFGDEGWGRIASSFKVIYHSPLTTLTILRIARPHYRLLWSSLTLLTSILNQPVLPRVIAISGTIKKLQNRGIAYHRLVTARALASLDGSGMDGLKKEDIRHKAVMGFDKEIRQIKTLEDA